MPALQFATATANLASQNAAFLFLATHGPIFIAASSSATQIQLLTLNRDSKFTVETVKLLSH